MRGLIDLAECCGWWAPYKHLCIFQDRHNILRLDDFGRIHCEDGPAIAYPSGWCIYAIHGVRVPEQVVMDPASLTLESIKSESNAEVRRIMIDRFGFGKYLEASDSKVIDRDFVDVQIGHGQPMPRVLIRDPFDDTFLYGTDGSTERCYAMPVPSTVNTCREAHQAICGLNEDLCVAQS
jgi:hypothetical protein